MQTVYLVTHNLIRWGVVMFGLWTLIQAISGVMTKRAYNKRDLFSSMFFSIFCDIQLLLGLVLIFMGPWIDIIKSGMGNVMKNNHNRFFLIEHALIMIFAWILVRVGSVKVKKAPEASKHKKMLLFFGIALLLILASIPWPFRTEVARPLFRSL